METQISLDLLLFGRCLAALFWGIGLACWLQFARVGQFLAQERTWVTVVAGVGVDLLIAYGGCWWTVTAVVVCSSLGIIARSLINESHFAPDLEAYRTKWMMEDTVDLTGDIIGKLEKALRQSDDGTALALMSGALADAHEANRVITVARYGQPETGKKKRVKS